ncbi:type VI secretion system-associated FHA domain protein TagH [Sansalvadorimonas sp. 2012CJ34-2]|uniref:Type VI secretion system-associated FHA domain protein TagH n=1 Tax=Parendozoicomonas callyspongiae TaxID=2942213 RepID=A0ABT0PDG7_9GAMM|nr:type VI secretion system-associated FHA domain protein TagH [Sansalvadorimonas sp. 2012CJ34-2]MCL6269348.1 type VI secretion system-associated FHA domain protein TagH [Sansalvadorimonas sp. 2012CJ34-2]
MAEDLVLEVIDSPAEANMCGHTKTFAGAGGSIGRSDSNSWVLPDVERIVSSIHADILYADSDYYLVDKSTNGTFINGTDHPVGSGKKVKINDGDIIGVGLFQIKAVLQVRNVDLPDGLGGVDFLDDSDKTTIGSIAAQSQDQAGADGDNDQFDQWLEPGQKSSSYDVWGSVNPSIDMAEAPADPLASLSGTSTLDPLGATPAQDILDPLEALSDSGVPQAQSDISSPWGSQPQPQSQEADDQWWLSEADNAPAVQQSIAMPKPAQPVTPEPVQQQAPVKSEPSLDDMSLDQLLTPSEYAPIGQAFAEAPSVEQVAPVKAQLQPEVQQSAQPQVEFPPQPQPRPVVPPVPQPVKIQQPPIAESASVNADSVLMTQLGLTDLAPSDLAGLDVEAAAFIRETVSRLMDLLRARSTIKNELRVERTMIQSQDNNPLKFSAGVDDALTMMFGKNSNAFMSPEYAVKDSFDNVSDHQVAVLAAMRSAFESMLASFAPDNLENLFGRMNGKGFAMNKKAKNWQSYQDWYRKLAGDSETAYNRLFGEVFTEAYEKKISELTAIRNLK